MVNFLEETIEAIKEGAHKTIEDVVWIGTIDGSYACDWKAFEKLADFNYDDGYGRVRINIGLVVVFKDGSWLEREEYDGAEWWEFKQTPMLKPNYKKLTKKVIKGGE